MNKQKLLDAGKQVFSIACATLGNCEHNRAMAKSAVLSAITQVGAIGMVASFAGDYAMAQFGYGGGM